ncbi:MAG: DUF5020 family protein [Saprospiraceae bacterium]|nr:DUF5020 family protein [Saprospiraceae bacterium]
MKNVLFLVFTAFTLFVQAQQVQLHYDFRHSIDPEFNIKNFPSLSFEYFKENDSLGSFLLKMQTDFTGEKSNPAQVFLQVSQNLRFWKPKVYLALNYSGGLGIAPPAYGYYISNAFSAGVSYPFQWKGAIFSANLNYRYTAFTKGSHDMQFNFYFWKGFFNYKLQTAGSFVAWTQNRDQGIEFTKDMNGKKFAFFGDPQIWLKVTSKISIGSRINIFYHVLTDENEVQVYPTLALKREF